MLINFLNERINFFSHSLIFFLHFRLIKISAQFHLLLFRWKKIRLFAMRLFLLPLNFV